MGKIETTPFDAAKYLTEPEDQANLLADAFASGQIGYIRQALNTIARARGVSALAKETGLTRMGLYKAFSPAGDPRLSTLLGVAKALNMELVMAPRTKVERPAARKRS